MTSPFVSVIIVNWNATILLRRCLANLREQAAADVVVEIVVVDNASTDCVPETLQREFPEITLVINPTNRGFAAASNQGVAQAHGNYLLWLNPDTVMRPCALRRLLDYAEAHPRIGALGPRLFNTDGSPQRSCWSKYPGLAMALSDAVYLWKFDWLPTSLTGEILPGKLRDVRVAAHLLGACLLTRREIWDAVGPLDEGYFLYFEETEWCWRVARAGWEVAILPSAEVTHFGQSSSRQVPDQSLSNYYASLYRFCRVVRGYQGGRLATLKAILYLAVVVRWLLWHWRERRRLGATSKEESRRMQAGYARVFHEIASLS